MRMTEDVAQAEENKKPKVLSKEQKERKEARDRERKEELEELKREKEKEKEDQKQKAQARLKYLLSQSDVFSKFAGVDSANNGEDINEDEEEEEVDYTVTKQPSIITGGQLK